MGNFPLLAPSSAVSLDAGWVTFVPLSSATGAADVDISEWGAIGKCRKEEVTWVERILYKSSKDRIAGINSLWRMGVRRGWSGSDGSGTHDDHPIPRRLWPGYL